MSAPEKTPVWPSALSIVAAIVSVGASIAAHVANERADYAEAAYERLRNEHETDTRALQLRHESARECCRNTQGEYTQCIAAFKLVEP